MVNLPYGQLKIFCHGRESSNLHRVCIPMVIGDKVHTIIFKFSVKNFFVRKNLIWQLFDPPPQKKTTTKNTVSI